MDGSFVGSHFLFSFPDQVGGRIFSFRAGSAGNVLSKGDTGEVAAGRLLWEANCAPGFRFSACPATFWHGQCITHLTHSTFLALPAAAASHFFTLVPAPGNLSAFSAANPIGPLSPVPMPVAHQASIWGCACLAGKLRGLGTSMLMLFAPLGCRVSTSLRRSQRPGLPGSIASFTCTAILRSRVCRPNG